MIIQEGEQMPWGYGFSYRLWDRYAAVAYPFPLNHLVALARTVWFYVRDAHISKMEREALARIRDAELKSMRVIEVAQQTAYRAGVSDMGDRIKKIFRIEENQDESDAL